jgi:hypothetical protein
MRIKIRKRIKSVSSSRIRIQMPHAPPNLDLAPDLILILLFLYMLVPESAGTPSSVRWPAWRAAAGNRDQGPLRFDQQLMNPCSLS